MHLRSLLNATLAGGVAMGCSHSTMVPPWIAALLGIVVSASSALGEWRLVEWCELHLKLYDTQGVLWNLVVPASVGWLVTVIVSAAGTGKLLWGTPFDTLFPSPNHAGYLAASWILALALAMVVGVLSGFILSRMRPKPQYWTDSTMFATGVDFAEY
jgi:hypothetical protein